MLRFRVWGLVSSGLGKWRVVGVEGLEDLRM
jgi:hypothetical protein